MKKNILLIVIGLFFLSPIFGQNSFHFNSVNDNKRQDLGVSSGVLTFGGFVNDCTNKFPENIDWEKILVGIGIKNPSATLHINGKKGSTFRMTDGTENDGFVLTSDANGNGTWQPVASGNLSDADWFKVGTTQAPMNISDNKFTLGNIGIGTLNPGPYRLAIDSGMVFINGAINSSDLSSTSFFNGGPGKGLQLQNGSDYGGLLLTQNDNNIDNNDFIIYFGDNPQNSGTALGNDLRFCFAQWNGQQQIHQFIDRMRLTWDGNLGIGTSAPTDKLTVFNGTTTGTYTIGGWAHSSDLRFKTNIQNIENAMDKVNKLNGVYYYWKNNEIAGRQLGFVAQDVKKVIPEVVFGTEGDLSKGEILSMVYQNLIPILVEALKEKDKQINEINQKIDNLQSEIEIIRKNINPITQN